MGVDYCGKPKADEFGIETHPFYSRAEYVAMNMAFAHAMLQARRLGDEKFTIGPLKDHTVVFATHFSPQIRHSLMTSSAATCAEAAGAESLPATSIPSMGGHYR